MIFTGIAQYGAQSVYLLAPVQATCPGVCSLVRLHCALGTKSPSFCHVSLFVVCLIFVSVPFFGPAVQACKVTHSPALATQNGLIPSRESSLTCLNRDIVRSAWNHAPRPGVTEHWQRFSAVGKVCIFDVKGSGP